MHKRLLFVSRLARANFPLADCLLVETAPVPSITEGFLGAAAEMARAKMHKRVHFCRPSSCRQACHHCHNRKQRNLKVRQVCFLGRA